MISGEGNIEESTLKRQNTPGIAPPHEKTLPTVDFQKVYDLTGSTPKYLTYRHKPLSFGYTWTDLYVRVVTYLCKEHPEILQPGLSFSKQHPHVELSLATDAADIQKPCALPGTDLVLETKLTANEMVARIQYLIERCHMEYTDVIIQYKKLTAPTPPSAPLDPARIKAILQQYFPYGFQTNSSFEFKKFRAAYATLYTDTCTATDKMILCAMRKPCIIHNKVAYLPSMLVDEGKTDATEALPFDGLLQEERYTDLRNALSAKNITTIDALQHINLWSFMNENNLYTIQQRLAITTELTKILQNRNVSAVDTPSRYAIHYSEHVYIGNTPSIAFVAFLADFATQYPLKFRSLINMVHPTTGKVVIHRHDLTGHKLELLNPEVYIDAELTREQVELYITWICSRCSTDTTFSIEELPQTEVVSTEKDSTPSSVERQRDNSISLETHTLLPKAKPVPPQTPAPTPTIEVSMTAYAITDMKRAEQYLRTRDLDGVPYEDLQTQLGWSGPYTKTVVSQSHHIIEMNKRLYHEDAFVDFEDGATALAEILEKLFNKNNGITTATQLWEYARSEMSMFCNDNDITEPQAIYDLAKHLFDKLGYQDKHYTFRSNTYISLPGISADSHSSIVQKYAREKGTTVTMQELEEYLKQLGLSTSNLSNILRGEKAPLFLLYQDKEYLLTELMQIDDAFLEQMKTALSHLFADVGDYSILRQIADSWYTLLPQLPASLKWTPLLLQQMLRFYAKRLDARTIPAMVAQNSSTLHAMLVKNDCWIQNFCDAVAIYLHEELPERQSFEAEELRRILLAAGMVSGNELWSNMPKALGGDPRFIWNKEGSKVTVRI